MRVPGLCSICGKPATLSTCALCGASVCPSHFDQGKGLCLRCAEPAPVE